MGPRSTSKKRQDVLEATLRLTVDNGFQGTSTALIAEEAGVGMGTIYRYFKNKEELFSVLFNELRNKFMNIVIKNYKADRDPYLNFRSAVYVLVTYYIDNPHEFRYLERYSDSSLKIGRHLDESSRLIEPVSTLLAGKDHPYTFKKLPPLMLFAMTYGPLVAIVNLVHMGKVELTDELIYEVADAIWDSILEK